MRLIFDFVCLCVHWTISGVPSLEKRKSCNTHELMMLKSIRITKRCTSDVFAWLEMWKTKHELCLQPVAPHHNTFRFHNSACLFIYMHVHCLDIQQMLSALTSLYWIMNLKLRCAFLWSLPSRLRFSFDPSFVSIFLLHFVLQRLGFQCNFINFLKYNIDAGCITVIYSLATALMLNLVFPLERCGALCQYLWL